MDVLGEVASGDPDGANLSTGREIVLQPVPRRLVRTHCPLCAQLQTFSALVRSSDSGHGFWQRLKTRLALQGRRRPPTGQTDYPTKPLSPNITMSIVLVQHYDDGLLSARDSTLWITYFIGSTVDSLAPVTQR